VSSDIFMRTMSRKVLVARDVSGNWAFGLYRGLCGVSASESRTMVRWHADQSLGFAGITHVQPVLAEHVSVAKLEGLISIP
jgi:hypothetical protein